MIQLDFWVGQKIRLHNPDYNQLNSFFHNSRNFPAYNICIYYKKVQKSVCQPYQKHPNFPLKDQHFRFRVCSSFARQP